MTRRRSLSDSERRLWRLAMRGAEPMPGRALPPEPPEPSFAASLEPPPDTPALPSTVPAAPKPRAVPAPKLELGVIRDVDGRTADRLRRGRMEIDGRIDLHGMTQAQAHTALAAFVHRAWHEGRRCVLVITGKGTYSTGGVLRSMAPRWLAEPVLARMVLAIQPAQPMHGGDGALYVLIKRRREAASVHGPRRGAPAR